MPVFGPMPRQAPDARVGRPDRGNRAKVKASRKAARRRK